jgi:hypothetical protein
LNTAPGNVTGWFGSGPTYVNPLGNKSVNVIPATGFPDTTTSSVYIKVSPEFTDVSDTCLANATLLVGVGVTVNVLVGVLV